MARRTPGKGQVASQGHAWLLRQRESISCSSEVLKPINYMLRRWDEFVPLPTIVLRHALRGIALERRNWSFGN